MPERLTLLAVHAHPDDEALSMGGTFARAHAEGVYTVLICATRGEEGEILDPTLNPDEARARFGHIREAELRRASAVLQIDELHILGYRDSGMAGTDANSDPRSFCGADPEEAAERIVRIMRQTRPQVVVTYNEHGNYGHPDHIAAHRATVAAFEAAGDPSRFPHQSLRPWQPLKLYAVEFSRSSFLRFRDFMRAQGYSVPFDQPDDELEAILTSDDRITTWVDTLPFIRQRRDAIAAHRSQIPSDHPLLTMPDEAARLMYGCETYRRLFPHDGPEREVDLFAGLR